MSSAPPVTAPHGEGAAQMDATRRARYEDLRDQGLAAAQRGRLEESRSLCREALLVAQELGDRALTTRALCNLASVDIEAEQGEAHVAPLRDMLVRNSDDESCRLAAYHLARFYDLRKQTKKALFYARIALERARQLDNPSWLASSCNQTALLLLSESRFEEASQDLDRALALLGADDEIASAMIRDNLGYCRFLQGRHEQGFALCFRSLRVLRRRQHRPWAAELTLAFGYLQIGRGHRALHHSRVALDGAEMEADRPTIKNALFLLGEAAQSVGDDDGAYDYFLRLQREFYPDQLFLPNFLLAVDVSGLVNLKA